MNPIFKANSDMPLDNRALTSSAKTVDDVSAETNDFSVLRQLIEEKACPEEVYSNQDIEALDVETLFDELSLTHKQTTPIEEAEILLSRLSESASALQQQLVDENTTVMMELDAAEFSQLGKDGKELPPHSVLGVSNLNLPVSDEHLIPDLSQEVNNSLLDVDESLMLQDVSALPVSITPENERTLDTEDDQWVNSSFAQMPSNILNVNDEEKAAANGEILSKTRVASTIEQALKSENELIKAKENTTLAFVDEASLIDPVDHAKSALNTIQNKSVSDSALDPSLLALDPEKMASSLMEGDDIKKSLSLANQSSEAKHTLSNKPFASELGNNFSLYALSQMPSKAEHAIKQQQPPMPLSTNIAQAGEALAERLNVMMSRNLKHVDIRLDPPELGKMQIKLALNQDQASVQIIVANQAVREIVEQTMPRLREMMQQQGLQLGQASVDQQSSQSGQGFLGRNGQDQSGSPSANAKYDTGAVSFSSSQEDKAQSMVNYAVLPKGSVDYYA